MVGLPSDRTKGQTMAKLIELLVVFSIYAFLSLCGGLIFSHIGLELIKNLKAHNANFDPFLVEHNPQYTRADIEIAKHCKKEREKDNPRLDFLVRYCKHTIRVPAESPETKPWLGQDTSSGNTMHALTVRAGACTGQK